MTVVDLPETFFRLVAFHASARYMETTGCFKHNSLALQVLLINIC